MPTPTDTRENNILQKPLTVGDWILTIILLSIPLVGFVFLLYWALSSSSNINRKNYCIAVLIIGLIFTALLIALVIMGVFAGLMAQFSQTKLYVTTEFKEEVHHLGG